MRARRPQVPQLFCGLLAGLLLAGSSSAQERSVHAGPLVAFTEVEMADEVRYEVVRLAELDGTTTHQIDRSNLAARVIDRLDRDHVLLGKRHPSRLVVVHVPTGKQHELVRGKARYLGVRGDDVIFLEDPMKKGLLHKIPWREPGAPVRIVDQPLRSVPLFAGNIALGIGRDGRDVWLLSLVSNRVRKICSIPAGHQQPRLALSPSGTHLAIGARDRTHRGIVRIVEVATAKGVRTFDKIPIFVSALSSSMPTLELAFGDDDHVTYSESRGNPRGLEGAFVHVTRNIRTGEIADEITYSDLELHHKKPDFAPVQPLFEIARLKLHSELRERGDPTPLATVRRATEKYGDLLISRPDGRYATARLGDRREHLTLFRPGAAEPRRLSESWAYNLKWLPAAK